MYMYVLKYLQISLQVCRSLCDPCLSLSQEEEEEEKIRAKKSIKLLKVGSGTALDTYFCVRTVIILAFATYFQVLATITPTNFSSKEVCEQLVSLIRNEDIDIGSEKHSQILLVLTILLFCFAASPMLQILTLAGEHIDKSITGYTCPPIAVL